MRRLWAGVALVALLGGPAAWAQSGLEPRVDRLEREMRAVQRKVFPNGSGALVEPDIRPQPSDPTAPGTPASDPVADLTQRISALEGGLSQLTGQVEQAENRLRQVEEQFNAYRKATDGRIKALESAGTAAAAADLPAGDAADDSDGAAPRANGNGTLQLPGSAGATRPASTAGGGAARAAQVRAVARPSSGDAAEDGYLYGYRLWQAKFYPEAETALKDVVAKYPSHRRWSFAQNLLGRAYLDEGKPSLASIAFYDNYKKMPTGERAPDSLFYLAQALVKLGKPADACKVWSELTESYPDKISAGMKADISTGRAAAKCK